MHENRLLQPEIQPDLLIDPAVHFHPNGIDKPRNSRFPQSVSVLSVRVRAVLVRFDTRRLDVVGRFEGGVYVDVAHVIFRQLPKAEFSRCSMANRESGRISV